VQKRTPAQEPSYITSLQAQADDRHLLIFVKIKNKTHSRFAYGHRLSLAVRLRQYSIRVVTL
jgi:hypothetical protein